MNNVLMYANLLEDILTKYLDCHWGNFGVKANGYLDNGDWKSPINFALGCKYGEAGKSEKMKDEIENFIGNILKGKNMEEIVQNYEQFGYSSENEAYKYLEETIKKLDEILNS